ncbi:MULTISPECIES: transposase [Cyanophyceae]|uniref:IS110 family transposase n=1 Tax=Cyanophyceae TaxID=3028117 RepID=UPI0003029D1A|nr:MULTISPECIES: transposase [Cyanophyceae]
MNSSSKKPSYTGKNVFIGIDVHKRTYSIVSVVDSIVSVVEGIVVKKWQTTAIPDQLARQLKSYFPEANLYSVYEAGFSGFVLHRKLEEAGIKNLVVNAASIETTVHNRVKTDKRDALKLASLLEAGRLKGIRVPSEKEETQRLLSRTRQQLIKERTALKNQIRMKCHQMGLIAADDRRKMSHKLVQELLKCCPSLELSLAIETDWQVW